jgi:diacylglycerol O-acyltransferase
MSDAARRMSRVDTAWLRMDNDVNLMMIVGVWLLTPAVTLEALRERIADKLLKYERFRQKTVPDAMGAMWVEDENFDITRHVVPKSAARARGRNRTPRAAASVWRTGHDAAGPAPPAVAVSPG